MKEKREALRRWISAHRRRLYVGVPLGILLAFVLCQLLYPSDRLLPFQHIDGVVYGGWQKSDTANSLDKKYANRSIELYFGDADKPQYSPKPHDIGLTIDNKKRVQNMGYAWYLRLVPTSVFWAHGVQDIGKPTYSHSQKQLAAYMKTELGGSCRVAPLNATAEVKGDRVKVVKEEPGGTCEESAVRTTLAELEPRLDSSTQVSIGMETIPAALTAAEVRPVVDTINVQLGGDVQFTYDSSSTMVEPRQIRSWLVFSTDDDTFNVGFDAKKAEAFLTSEFSKKVAVAAGVSKVKTHDFVEVSRQDGAPGRALDVAATLAHLHSYVVAEADDVPVGVKVVEPKVEYTRTYSNTDTGISALMKNYAESHNGVYGVSLIELDDKRRRAAYQDDKKFTTASTYKLYVAYSTLRRVESGEFKWSDQVHSGRDLAKCFDDMIVKSDNACAEALVAKIGYRPLTTDAQSIVSANTTFLDTESYKTTAGDLSTFMASLATGQIPLNESSRTRFIDALKRNEYRQGVPAGASGQVADKVGFLDGLLHDAAIVYSPSGTYVLSVMTDKSSWTNIAELTSELEKLRSQ